MLTAFERIFRSEFTQLLCATTLCNYFIQQLNTTSSCKKNETCLHNFHFDCVNEICINFVILSHFFIGSADVAGVDAADIILMLELFAQSSFFNLDIGQNSLGRS